MKLLPSLLCFLAAATLNAGCGGARTPQDTARAYARALERDDLGAARALLAPELRAAATDTQIAAEFERRVEAGRPLRASLQRAADADAVLTAHLQYSRYETISLGYVDGSWRITGGVADLWDRSTPRAAVIAFVRAVRADDAAALLQLVPGDARGWTDEAEVGAWLTEHRTELEEMVALLESGLQQPIAVSGGEAFAPYGSSVMRLAREGSAWVIVDFE